MKVSTRRRREAVEREAFERLLSTGPNRPSADVAERLRTDLRAHQGGLGCEYVSVEMDEDDYRIDGRAAPRPASPDEIDRSGLGSYQDAEEDASKADAIDTIRAIMEAHGISMEDLR